MVLTNKLRQGIKKYALLETIFLMVGFLSIGYFIDANDPALISYELSYVIVLLAIITLFHGAQNGLLALLILSVAIEYFYTEYPVEVLLKIFVLVLIFGEFHYYWNRKISHNKSKNAYLSKKLDELSNAFYTLKISHDQLEKNYVFKPMSVRNSIRMLKEAYEKNQDYYGNFLTLLEKSFNVSEADFCQMHKGKLYSISDKEHHHEIGHSDPMVKMALMKKTPIYVSADEVENSSAYLAVIPVVSQASVQAVLLIKQMPFMSFNKDNLISISIIISYFLDELSKWKLMKSDASKSLMDADFYYELQRLKTIYDDFEVNSTVLVMKSKDPLLAHLLSEKIEVNLRSLDMLSHHTHEQTEVLAMLFPFADESSAQGFLTRLMRLLNLQLNDIDLEVSFFDIAQLDILKSYIGIEKKNV